MTQKQLATKLHVSHATVSKWERGIGFPDISLIEPLTEALGISIEELFAGRRTRPAPVREAPFRDVLPCAASGQNGKKQ